MKRQYIPAVGTLAKMREWSDYTKCNLSPWGWLFVVATHGDSVKVRHAPSPTDRTKDGPDIDIPLSAIAPPIGWKSHYTIHCAPEKVAEVMAWFERGIVVRQSQYIGDGSTAFQPLDNSGQPSWKFGEVTDTISPEDCPKVFRVVKLETWYDVSAPAPCEYCNGTGTRIAKVCHVPHLAPTVGAEFPCWTCDKGTARKHMRSMPTKEKKALRKALEAEGWKVEYVRRGEGYWVGERETIVHDWAA